MSVWFRRRSPANRDDREQRSTDPFPAMSIQSWLSAIAAPYNEVSVSTPEQAMQVIAVRSAMDLIASLGSELPIRVYSGQGSDRRRRPTPGYLEDPAGDGHGLEDWAYQVVMSWLARGNLYGDILARSSTGLMTQVLPLHPDTVRPQLVDGDLLWTVNGRPAKPGQLLHRRVNAMPGTILGLDPIALHATQIGLPLTASRFGLQWFRDGAHPGSMLINTQVDMTPERARTAKDRFLAAIRGTREPLVLGKGWEYKQIQLTPEQSQFLQTQGYSEAQCARIFGPGIAEVLGYQSGGSLTYTNVESRSAHLLVYSVNKWLRRLERLLTEMLPKPQYVVIDRDGILQSTTLERYRAHESALKNRWKTINEVRDDEDMPAVAWGDEPNTNTGPTPPEPDEPTGAETPPKDGA